MSQLFSELMSLLVVKPAELTSSFESLAVVSDVKSTMNVTEIIDSAVQKRNKELYEAEMNKDT